ncbi:hypothetical protein KC906_01710, partial [Candidatus Kaiserbacteria bacterium]|nr:hypothetical protein [Candidatus Kaiserbacteria bacterium]
MSQLKRKFPLLLTILLFAVPLLTLAEGPGTFDNILWNIVNSVFGTLAGLAGLLLNSGINTYVIGFGDQVFNNGIDLVINNLWTAVRDIFNLTFIFGLVYIGIKMILDSDNSNTRRWLVSLILAALLVNFSLFITKVVVDFTNILARQIAINGFNTAADGEVLVSETFMRSLGITKTWGGMSGFSSTQDGGVYAYIFGSMILFIIMAFVFAAGGILLIIRYVVLIFYMILSPLMFLGWVFPQMQGFSSRYWRNFLSRAFVAPVYLLLLYCSAFVVSSMYNGRSPDYAAALNADGGSGVLSSFENTIPTFIIASVFLIASIVIAQKMGAEGASTAVNIGRNLTNKARQGAIKYTGRAVGGATAGAAAAGMRRTVGRRAYNLTQDAGFKERAGNSLLGKMAFKAAQKTASSSFDVRQAGGLGKATGLGTGAAGGYAKTVSTKAKEADQFAKDIHVDQDKNSPEYIAKVNEKEKELKQNVRTEQLVLAAQKQALEETTNKTSTQIAENITEATKELAEAQKALKEAQANKQNFTKDEMAGFEADVKVKAGTVTGLKYSQDVLKRKEAVHNSKATEAQKKDQLAAINNEFVATGQSFDNQIDQLGKKIEGNKARASAAAQVEYANELAYMDQLKSTEDFWNRVGSIATGGFIGNQYATGAVGLVGGAGTAYAVGAGGAGLM